jgi:hypothetical protein
VGEFLIAGASVRGKYPESPAGRKVIVLQIERPGKKTGKGEMHDTTQLTTPILHSSSERVTTE